MIIQGMDSPLARYEKLETSGVFEKFYNDKIVYSCVLVFFLQPTEQNTYADIEAAYECLQQTYGVKEEDVILYGQSVGSGPTVDMASRLSRLRAVVLHSPILSGLRVMYPVKRTYWFDIFKVIMIQTCEDDPLLFCICHGIMWYSFNNQMLCVISEY